MTPQAMVATALLLGAFVVAAGAWGLLYCAFRLRPRRAWLIGSHVSRAAMCLIAVALVTFTPLHLGWKVLVAGSCTAYLAIPGVTWRYLRKLHAQENASHGPRSARRSARILPDLSGRA